MITIHYHFYEMKLRFLYLSLSALVTFLLCFHYQIEIVYVTGKPFIELQQTFIFLELTEAFYTVLRLCTLFTLLLVIPLFFYQIWGFFIPSFYKFERNQINLFFLLVASFLTLEIFFTYFSILPKICRFLISFEMASSEDISQSPLLVKPLLSVEFTAQIGSYVALITKIFTTLLILFQIPLILSIFYAKKIFSVSSLYFNRKTLCFLSFLISALIVPPDIGSQLLVALILYFILELLIFIGLFFESESREKFNQ